MTKPNDPLDATVDELAQLFEERHRSVGWVQRIANRSTRTLGRPGSLGIVISIIFLWIGGNQAARSLGLHAIEGPPFPILELIATLAALLTTLLILTTQRHEEQSDLRRDRLTLQIAVLSEKKVAKIIALLEEQRRDNPLLASRVDNEADQMAEATDPRESLHKIEASEQANDVEQRAE